jgi:hypothetical protein
MIFPLDNGKLAFKPRLCLIPFTLQSLRKFFRGTHPSRAALAILLIVLLSLAAFFSVDVSLHQWVHPDAAQPDHQCAITALERHHLVSSDVLPDFVVAEAGLIVTYLPAETTFISSDDSRLSPSRAPPISSLL